MSLGKQIRKILGNNFFYLSKIYRALFVDIDLLVRLIPYIYQYKLILDLGGGDGEILNYIFKYNNNCKIILSDISNEVGGAIKKQYSQNVLLFPETEFTNLSEFKFDLIMINYVLHHIPKEQHVEFFKKIDEFLKYPSCVLITEIQSGHLKSLLSYLSDRYISGDKKTNFVDKDYLLCMIKEYIKPDYLIETNLYSLNPPSYQFFFTRN